MTSLNERIRKGEAAITRAKARGQDVTAWEEHLGKLKALVHVTSSDKTVADVTEGRIVAVEICSEVLQAHIWLAFDDAFDPGDGRAVFYGHELEWLKTKTPEQLQETHKAKLIFGRDTKIKGGSMEEKPKLGSDSEGLGFWSAEIGTVGRVSEVNGAEARDVPEFVPTKHEVIQIAKYWERRRLQIQLWFFVTGQSGSSEWRENFYASRRIDRIAGILPEEELNQALEEVKLDSKQEGKFSDEEWDIFKNGTEEQWKSFQDKMRQELESK